MSRPLRIEYPGAYYHVMNRGLERRATFLEDADHQRFLALLDDASRRWQIEVYAYCCMTTHFHLVLQTPRGNLSRVMRHVDGLYTQWFNRIRGRDGPLFRGRYKAILIDSDRYLMEVVRYVHLNPVTAGVTTDPGAYRWSSHRLYRRGKSPPWLVPDRILGQFSSLRAFEQFVAAGNDRNLVALYQRKRWSPFLGDRDFLAAALKLMKASPEHPRVQRTPQFASIEDVVRRITVLTGTPRRLVLQGQRGRRNLARSLAIYAASRIAGFSHPEIRRHFRLGSNSAVSQICWRMVGVASKRPALRRLIAQL